MSASAARWHQKIVLIVGGSAGLGLAIAKAFSQAGATLVLAARDPARLAEAAAELGGSPAGVHTLAADALNEDAVKQLVEAVVLQHGRLDVLVYCAGRSTRGEALSTQVAAFRELLELNFLSAVRCIRAAGPHVVKAQGHIVLIGSLSSKAAAPYLGAYPASKHALAAYAHQLRLELGPRGVHVLLVCPGPLARQDAGERYREQAADLPASAGLPGGGVKLAGIDQQWLAHRIVRACQQRQAELVVPGKARLLFALAQLWPALGDWIIRRKTQQPP